MARSKTAPTNNKSKKGSKVPGAVGNLAQFLTKNVKAGNAKKLKSDDKETTAKQITEQSKLSHDSTNLPMPIEIDKATSPGSGERDGTCTPTPSGSPSRSSQAKKQ